MANDPLLEGATIALSNIGLRNTGAKTRYNHIGKVNRFVQVFRMLDYTVKMWKNISNKHIDAVVTYWREEKMLAQTTTI